MNFNNKKADLDVSMSWIFMIIVGTVFLVLAYLIVDKYFENENQKYELELKQSLRSILNNAGRTTGIEENSIKNAGNLFNGKSAEVRCINSFPILWIDEGKITDTQNQFTQNSPIFMSKIGPSKSENVYIAVESYRLPFKITNMVAITTNKNLIVFDKNSNITKKYLYKFNKGSYKNLNYIADYNFDSDFQSIVNYAKDKNLDSIVFVSDKKTPIDPVKLNQIKVFLYQVQIEENGTKGEYGSIYYIDDKAQRSNYNYIDYDNSLGIITMAIFSTPETFKCSYDQILNNIPQVYSFYILKTTFLYNISKNNSVCSSSLINYGSVDNIGFLQQEYYLNLNSSLTKFKKEIITVNDDIATVNFNNPKNVYSLLTAIEVDFKNLEKYNCPYVY